MFFYRWEVLQDNKTLPAIHVPFVYAYRSSDTLRIYPKSVSKATDVCSHVPGR
jgi:hypothetical protein